MYTFYFQSVPTLGGNMFRLTAHNTYVVDPSLGELYPEDTLRFLSEVGYRVVIDPSPANLARLKSNEFLEPEQPLQLAPGFRAIYPPMMFAIPRTELQTDQQDAAFDEQANRLESNIGRDHYFSRARCGEDIPPDDGIEIYRQDGAPSAGPLPPQAPLAPTEKVDEYGVPEIGSYEEYFSTKTLTPPEGSMLLPSTYQGVSGIQNEQNASEEKPQGFWAWLSEIFGFDNTDES